MAPKRNFSDPRVSAIFARYKRDLRTVKAVTCEVERVLGWSTTPQTIWRHLKCYEQNEAQRIRARSDCLTTKASSNSFQMESEAPHAEVEVELVDVDDDTRSSPAKLTSEPNISTKREECCDAPSSWTASSRSGYQSLADTRQLTVSSVVIPDRNNPNWVRVYRKVAANKDTEYFSCATCDSIARKSIAQQRSTSFDDSGAVLPEADVMREGQATVKTVHGRVVGNPFPVHHPHCYPISAQHQRAAEINSSHRVSVSSTKGAWCQSKRRDEGRISEYSDQEEFQSQGRRVAKRRHRTADDLYEQTAAKQTHSQESHATLEESGRIYGEGQLDESVRGEETWSEDVPPVQHTLSKRLTMSSIVVPEPCGDTMRVYRMGSSINNGRICYYRCSKCETLANKCTTTAQFRAQPRARIKAVDGRVVGNPHPRHHPDCHPLSARLFKAQEIDQGCRFRIKQGLISPRRAWDLGQQIAESETSSVPFPQWDAVRRRYNRLSLGSKRRFEHVEDAMYVQQRFEQRGNEEALSGDENDHLLADMMVSNMLHHNTPGPSCTNPSSFHAPESSEETRREDEQECEGAEKLEQEVAIDSIFEDTVEGDGGHSSIDSDHSLIDVTREESIEDEYQLDSGAEHEAERDGEDDCKMPGLETESEDTGTSQQGRAGHCTCKRYYQVTLELQQDIARRLNEMKAVREHIKHMIHSRVNVHRRGLKALPANFFP